MLNITGVWAALSLILGLSGSPNYLSSIPAECKAGEEFQNPSSPPVDTLVNYCALLRAAFFYGDKSTYKNALLVDNDVKYFNELWSQVFNVDAYRVGITYTEFYSVHRFAEGNKLPFPPSGNYNSNNPDPYLVFHIAKEIGKISSKPYEQCHECVVESIGKINEWLKGTTLHKQVSGYWYGPGTLKKITSIQDVNDLALVLRCMAIDDRLDPRKESFFDTALPPVVKCPDTTIIKCKDEMKPDVWVGYRHCDVGGKVDTIGPLLVQGIDNCPGTIYSYKFVVKDFCFKKDSAYQFFKIKNDPPSIACPYDTMVYCIDDLVIHDDLLTTSSCSLGVTITNYGPLLLNDLPDCPYSVYEMQYTVKDTCGRAESCVQKITIQNDPPTIHCPPDRKVECFEDIKEEGGEFTTSCEVPASYFVISPIKDKNNGNCPGKIYELEYKLTDFCDRSVSCIQKFTIDNKGPEIICPPSQEVLCFEDIFIGKATSFKVACGMTPVLTTSPAVLITGKHNCEGAVYQVNYTVTDECGRSAMCPQFFTILKPDIDITCPPDQTVKCWEDIKSSDAIVKASCKQAFKVTPSTPKLKKGKDNCPGSEYEIVYHVVDACGRTKDCVQTFTIDNSGPLIVCYPDLVKECNKIPDYNPPVPLISCDLDYDLEYSELYHISGEEGCDGSVYGVTYTVTDACGRTAQCSQKITFHIPLPVIGCKILTAVDCENDIVYTPPEVKVFCDQAYHLTHDKPVLKKGIKNCPGAIYSITSHLEDDCDRTLSCEQLFEIAHSSLTITCPPDKIVHCVNDIIDEKVEVSNECAETRVDFTGPELESGKAGCANSVYTLTYNVTDVCGRKAHCVQRFRITGDELEVTCPPDITVMSKSEIHADDLNLKVTTSCGKSFERILYGPNLYSGIDDKPGAVYTLLYEVADRCGIPKTCRQLFTVKGIPDCASSYPNSEAVLNAQTNTYDCNCVTGYVWNDNRTACELPVPDCKSSLPNTVAVWNTAMNQYVCDCMPGYFWNSTKTECNAKPDCASYYPNTEAAWDEQTKEYGCKCIAGYIWNADRTNCILIKPDCSQNYPNSEAVLNQQTQQYECNCKEGYVWNSGRTGCELQMPDCNAFYPNTVALWNALSNEYYCSCQEGYVWNAGRTGCELQVPDCNADYPNTVAVKNTQTNQYECNCKQGYVWNAGRTGCELQTPDCNAYYPNTVAVMNTQTNQYECNCKQGYVWNAGRTGCELQTPDCNTYYPNTVAVLNAQSNQYECNCKEGYVWNVGRTGCVQAVQQPTTGEEKRYGPFTATLSAFTSTGLTFQKGGSFRVEATGICINKDGSNPFGPNGANGNLLLRGKINEQRFDLGASGSGYVNVAGTLELGIPRVMNFLGDDQLIDGTFTVYVFSKDAVQH